MARGRLLLAPDRRTAGEELIHDLTEAGSVMDDR
jgi:hypothetical protein